MIENGATPDIAQHGSELRSLYDLAFAYEGGQLDRPSYAAGTAVRAALRIVVTYKGALLYLMQAGMGEAVVAPLYEVLSARGVKVELFHKVKKLELSPDRNVVARVKLARQARTVGGKAYAPTFRVKGGDGVAIGAFLQEQLEGGDAAPRRRDRTSNHALGAGRRGGGGRGGRARRGGATSTRSSSGSRSARSRS